MFCIILSCVAKHILFYFLLSNIYYFSMLSYLNLIIALILSPALSQSIFSLLKCLGISIFALHCLYFLLYLASLILLSSNYLYISFSLSNIMLFIIESNLSFFILSIAFISQPFSSIILLHYTSIIILLFFSTIQIFLYHILSFSIQHFFNNLTFLFLLNLPIKSHRSNSPSNF